LFYLLGSEILPVSKSFAIFNAAVKLDINPANSVWIDGLEVFYVPCTASIKFRCQEAEAQTGNPASPINSRRHLVVPLIFNINPSVVSWKSSRERMDEIPRCFMMLRKETMTPEMGWRSAVAFPLRSALTMVRSASFRIRRPMGISSAAGTDPGEPNSCRRRGWTMDGWMEDEDGCCCLAQTPLF
jgi:hypothetical protein